MRSVIIIGGGLAAISAAAYLAEKNFEVTLLESSPFLGGRAKSFFDNDFNCYLDNGQHLLINGYKYSLELIRKINAENNFVFQEKFSISFRDKNLNEWQVTISDMPNSILSIIRFQNLNWKEKFLLISFFSRLKQISSKIYSELTALDLLRRFNQSENLINNFWKLLIESALNTPIDKASAEVFLFVLKKMFVEDKSNAALVIPTKSLYEALISPAENYLNKKNIKVIRSCRIEKIELENNSVKKIIDKNGNSYQADFYVLAVHPSVINKLMPDLKVNLDYQSIINLHLKIVSERLQRKFFALWDSIVHWVFFHEDHLTIVKSSADDLLKYSNEQILQIFIDELILFFPELEKELIQIKNLKRNYRVIKERRSTFLSDLDSLSSRPSCKTNIKNLFLAGDFVDTGYPSTIESAILSGKLVSEAIM